MFCTQENGVNKDNAAETSATESVNGDAAHKAIDVSKK